MSAIHTYCYEAFDKNGKSITGEMDAANSQAVIEHLHRLGYVPVAADRKAANSFRLKHLTLSRARHAVSLNDIAFVTQQLCIMLRAGLPIETALSMLASLAERPGTAKFLNDLLEDMRGGSSLADAFAAQKAELPKGYIGMISAGEMGGARALETTLDRIAEHLKRLQKMREGVFSAMLYPSIVLGMAALSIVVILVWVVPQFEPVFASAPPGSLPLSTTIVIAVAHGLRDYGLFLLLAALGLGLAVRALLKRETVRLQLDGFLLRLPKIGSLIVKAEMATFCNTLGVLLSNGVTAVPALSNAADGITNRILASAAERVVARVREGESFSIPMQEERIFPALCSKMIRIGEETGQLNPMLLKTAEIYDREVQRSTERLMTLLTPITTIVLGLIIATIIASVLSAILSINDLVTL
jgi:general secretion pathway protein F